MAGRCYRCGRHGHYRSQCYARFHMLGYELHGDDEQDEDDVTSCDDTWCCSYCDKEFGTYQEARFHEMHACKSVSRRGVYVLVLDDGTRYVGKSENVSSRVAQHMGESASAWCMKGGTTHARQEDPCTPPLDDLNLWEQKETVEQMLRHGCNRVRGWEFTGCDPLNDSELSMIELLVFGTRDACRKCGRCGHFAAQCSATTLAPWLHAVRQCRGWTPTTR